MESWAEIIIGIQYSVLNKTLNELMLVTLIYSLLFVSDTVARYFSRIFNDTFCMCVIVCLWRNDGFFGRLFFFALVYFIVIYTMHIMKYVLYIFIIYSSAGDAECLLHLFVYCIVNYECCTVLCIWIIFGYVWVYYVISPVDIECEWLQINSKIANQLCPSLCIKMTVSKLDLYCACSVLSPSLSLSISIFQLLCLHSFFFVLFQRLYTENNFNSVACHFLRAHMHASDTIYFLQSNTQHVCMCTLRFVSISPIHVC